MRIKVYAKGSIVYIKQNKRRAKICGYTAEGKYMLKVICSRELIFENGSDIEPIPYETYYAELEI